MALNETTTISGSSFFLLSDAGTGAVQVELVRTRYLPLGDFRVELLLHSYASHFIELKHPRSLRYV